MLLSYDFRDPPVGLLSCCHVIKKACDVRINLGMSEDTSDISPSTTELVSSKLKRSFYSVSNMMDEPQYISDCSEVTIGIPAVHNSIVYTKELLRSQIFERYYTH